MRKRLQVTATQTVKNYVEVTKPPIVLLLVFTSLATMIVAWKHTMLPLTIPLFAVAMVSITAASAGCDTLTSYVDRDIDAVMHRTRNRPIPSGRIAPNKALVWGLFLALVGLAVAYWINFLSFIWIALGVLDNVVVYSLFLKRRNPLNIILGGISGGLPVMFGWSVVTNSVELLPILLGSSCAVDSRAYLESGDIHKGRLHEGSGSNVARSHRPQDSIAMHRFDDRIDDSILAVDLLRGRIRISLLGCGFIFRYVGSIH